VRIPRTLVQGILKKNGVKTVFVEEKGSIFG
jgi:hypothetical protein